jgi:hypothetical protein
MMAGFVHGVLNTDNMNITGESFDYGPYRFLPTYDPEFTAAYFDHHGLYAFGRQPASPTTSSVSPEAHLASPAALTKRPLLPPHLHPCTAACSRGSAHALEPDADDLFADAV